MRFTDFKAPQAVIDALHEAVDYGVFGYPGGAPVAGPGEQFGLEDHGYMRVSLGCPRSTVDEAIGRLTSAIAIPQ